MEYATLGKRFSTCFSVPPKCRGGAILYKERSWKQQYNSKGWAGLNVSSCRNSKREVEWDSDESSCLPKEEARDEEESMGVKVALSMLIFYRREISPLMPKSCRYVPSCSEYSIIAYKRYGVAKGTILTAWRLCRCNPLGGSGFDPPRWFGEEAPPSD